MGTLFAKLPSLQFAHLQQAVDRHYLHLLRRDSADGHNPDEIRTPTQRLADVVFELLTNRGATTGEPLPDNAGVGGKAATQLIMIAPFDVVDGTNPDGQCELETENLVVRPAANGYQAQPRDGPDLPG